MDKLFDQLLSSLYKTIDPSRPLLVAVSGGPDSICLLHILVEWKNNTGCDIQVVHIDHGWRKESTLEASSIRALAATLSLPYHEKKLDPKLCIGNLEAACRLERLQFYKEIQQKTKAQAVVLGHHRDDQAETVFKRILEGASLTHVSGMLPVTMIDGLILLRPLLTFKKEDILAFLKERAIPYFDDITNYDESFLRARLRKSLFPIIRKKFGKAFEGNLVYISEEAALLRSYMDARVAPFMDNVQEGPFGSCIDLSLQFPTHEYELLEVVRHFVVRLGLSPSRAQIRSIVNHLVTSSANKQFYIEGQELYIDRRRMFHLSMPFPPIPDHQLRVGKQKIGPYTVLFEPVYDAKLEFANGWKDLFSGKATTFLSQGQYCVSTKKTGAARALEKGRLKSLDRFLTEKKIPSMLTSLAPFICKDGVIYEDFLAGYTPKNLDLPLFKLVLEADL